MQSDAMPRAAVAAICALLVGTAVTMTSQALALTTDGPFELVRVLDSGDVYGTNARLLAAWVRHGPVVAAAHAGVTDTHTLTLLFGIGQLVVPALLWSVAIVVTRRVRLICAAVTLVAALCCGVTWFAGISPIVLAAPLTVVVATVLWLPHDLRKRDIAVALGSCAVLVATYETAEIQAQVNYTKALIDLDRAMGMTLRRNGLELNKALTGSNNKAD